MFDADDEMHGTPWPSGATQPPSFRPAPATPASGSTKWNRLSNIRLVRRGPSGQGITRISIATENGYNSHRMHMTGPPAEGSSPVTSGVRRYDQTGSGPEQSTPPFREAMKFPIFKVPLDLMPLDPQMLSRAVRSAVQTSAVLPIQYVVHSILARLFQGKISWAAAIKMTSLRTDQLSLYVQSTVNHYRRIRSKNGLSGYSSPSPAANVIPSPSCSSEATTSAINGHFTRLRPPAELKRQPILANPFLIQQVLRDVVEDYQWAPYMKQRTFKAAYHVLLGNKTAKQAADLFGSHLARVLIVVNMACVRLRASVNSNSTGINEPIMPRPHSETSALSGTRPSLVFPTPRCSEAKMPVERRRKQKLEAEEEGEVEKAREVELEEYQVDDEIRHSPQSIINHRFLPRTNLRMNESAKLLQCTNNSRLASSSSSPHFFTPSPCGSIFEKESEERIRRPSKKQLEVEGVARQDGDSEVQKTSKSWGEGPDCEKEGMGSEETEEEEGILTQRRAQDRCLHRFTAGAVLHEEVRHPLSGTRRQVLSRLRSLLEGHRVRREVAEKAALAMYSLATQLTPLADEARKCQLSLCQFHILVKIVCLHLKLEDLQETEEPEEEQVKERQDIRMPQTCKRSRRRGAEREKESEEPADLLWHDRACKLSSLVAAMRVSPMVEHAGTVLEFLVVGEKTAASMALLRLLLLKHLKGPSRRIARCILEAHLLDGTSADDLLCDSSHFAQVFADFELALSTLCLEWNLYEERIVKGISAAESPHESEAKRPKRASSNSVMPATLFMDAVFHGTIGDIIAVFARRLLRGGVPLSLSLLSWLVHDLLRRLPNPTPKMSSQSLRDWLLFSFLQDHPDLEVESV